MTSQPPTAAHASWTVPGSLFTVSYSLPVLQEIEFAVNEGYRRIPHGGIEVGGLLLGRVEENSTSIEAFRLIPCEHARGPSFILSERDLDALRQQLAAAKDDAEVEGLRPVGWFISHTRGPLQMTEHEYALFEQFFPGAGAITLLAKPERFNPTQFAFLVRDSNGQVERDGSGHSVVLPSPGRPARTPERAPRPQAEAPQPRALPPEPVMGEPSKRPLEEARLEEPEEQLSLSLGPTAAEVQKPEVPNQSLRSTAEPQPISTREPESIHSLAAEPAVSTDAKPVPVSTPEAAPAFIPEPAMPISAAAASALPSIDEIRRRRWEHVRGSSPVTPEPEKRMSHTPPPQEVVDVRTAHHEITRKMREESNRSKLIWTATLVVAAVLGSAVGYWAYLQLRSATIPLTLQAGPAGLLVSWPAEQTRDAAYAAIQVDDAIATPLSVEEKTAGQALIKTAGDNVKIELLVQHWMRNSEGIIRYVRALKPAPPPPAPVPAKKRARREQ